jgi:CRP/FNR family transcriptional regulator, cyclic AMP receptor protein
MGKSSTRRLSVPDAVAVLGETALFGQLDAPTLTGLASESTIRSYRRGHCVFHQGDPGDCLFVVAEGLLKVFTGSDQGDDMVIATLRRPDTFGELAIIDGGPRSASVETLEPTVLLAVSHTAFTRLTRRYPSLLEAVLSSVAGLLRETLQRASDLVFLDLPGRVAKMILDLGDERGLASPEGIRVDVELTQGDLAASVGGSRSTVNQILRAFEGRGYIALQGRTLVLKQPELLRRRASG